VVRRSDVTTVGPIEVDHGPSLVRTALGPDDGPAGAGDLGEGALQPTT